MNDSENRINNELHDWIDALQDLTLLEGPEHTQKVINNFLEHINNKGILPEKYFSLLFENTIDHYQEEKYPGDWKIEEKIRHYIRWNALVTVLKAN